MPRIGAVLTTIVCATALGAAPASAQDTVITIKDADRAAAVAYWTPERMQRVGSEPIVPGETVAQKWPGSPPPGVGRYFFTEVPGGDNWCTATTVPSGNRDVAVTAGHCATPGLDRHDNPITVTNVVFVPGYDNGQRPHGVFPARALVVPAGYRGPASTADDVAMIVLDPVDGRHLADVAGTQRITFAQPHTAGPSTILGYPGSTLGRGESLFGCRLDASIDTNSVDSTWTSPCDMAGGSSGGPWLTGFDPATGTGTVFSVTSRGTVNADLVTTRLTGPLLEGDAQAVYRQAQQL
ncbi:hypothetical protein D5S17_06240 [Pseudonocardiaceae bacterium YIM PH 21723]|nr:hypothetical protein D5S17_06240 [Pseudonocardiaceae bacterium YIM PH 21723]